jgi:RNA polymerase sigma factor (sigma-70 family)
VSEAEFLEELKQNQGIIFKLTGLYARDPEEKMDLYQEIILNAWKGWASFRREAKFSTWLYRICLNTIFTQKRKTGIIDYKDSLEDVSPQVQHSSMQQEDSASLRRAIRLLSETDRAMVSLHLDGFENNEIAELLGITANHVAVKLHRCKQQLSDFLTP